MAVSAIDAVMGMHVDLSSMEGGLQSAEQLAQRATQSIAGKFSIMAAGIATAIVGVVIGALTKAIMVTQEWGEQMERLGESMGMTARQTATFTGVMERFGMHGQQAAMALQMMSFRARTTQQALDPFQTQLGQILGTLRNTDGSLMSVSQMFDLARQKISGMHSATDKLQASQQIFGARMGGVMLPILQLTNAEWEKQKSAVEGVLGPVNSAAASAMKYREESAKLEQTFRGIEITIGSKLLPILSSFMDYIANLLRDTKALVAGMGGWGTMMGNLFPMVVLTFKTLSMVIHGAKDAMEGLTIMTMKGLEMIGVLAKGSTDNFIRMTSAADAARKAAEAALNAPDKTGKPTGPAGAPPLTSQEEQKLTQQMEQNVRIKEQEVKLGIASNDQVREAIRLQDIQIANQIKQLDWELKQTGTTPAMRLSIQSQIEQLKMKGAQSLAQFATQQYTEEETHLKAMNEFNTTSEMQLLQKQLADARIVGDAREKIEAELLQKQKAYAEQAIKYATQLGFMSTDQEIAYRKAHAAELLGQGDVMGAAGELGKAKSLMLKQADTQMDFMKKIRVVSLQDEMEYQRRKLEVVKGNAAQEMQVISKIADLDKQLYDQRLQYGLNYTSSMEANYKKMADAAVAGGQEESFAMAKRDAERHQRDTTRMMYEVAAHGGTEAQRTAAVSSAQSIYKEIEAAQTNGEKISATLREAGKAAQSVLKAASGGEEVRAPGGPSPTIGSIMSPVEGLATQGLARGSDIPRLDTSFTDLATRLRDVLNTNVLNLTNFSNALHDAFKKISALTGTGYNAGAIGPGGSITAAGTPGQPPSVFGTATVAPGNTPVAPTAQPGIPSVTAADQGPSLAQKLDELIVAVKAGSASTATLQSTQAANLQSLASAVQEAKKQQVNVSVRADPSVIIDSLTHELVP